MYGKVFGVDGTYRTTQAEFLLYHLVKEDNGDSQPVFFFIWEVTTKAMSANIFTCNEILH
jgi:hypothetical protein